MLDWTYGIALHSMQGNGASSIVEGDVSWDASSCGRNLGYILELLREWPFETPLEVLVDSWLPSSVKDRESAVILRQYGVHGAFLELLY